MENRIINSAAFTLFVFGLAGWIYIAAIALVHPETLSWQLTHLTPWLREDVFGIISFIISFFSFFVWNITRK